MLLRNTVTSLLMSIQSLAGELRGSQSTYLKRVKARDESVQQYFDDDVFVVTLKAFVYTQNAVLAGFINEERLECA